MNTPKLMIIGTTDPFTRGVAEYATALAHRMGCDLLAVHFSDPPLLLTDTLPRLSDRQFDELARRARVSLTHRTEGGTMNRALPRLCHEIKRLSLIIADAGLCVEKRHIHPTIPVVEFCTDFKPKKGGTHMASTNATGGRKKILTRTAITGIMTVALYTLLFTHEGDVTAWFTKGGGYAALPILTAFLFSLVHGAFTSNFWTLLGVEAKTTAPPKTEQPSETAQPAKTAGDSEPVIAPLDSVKA